MKRTWVRSAPAWCLASILVTGGCQFIVGIENISEAPRDAGAGGGDASVDGQGGTAGDASLDGQGGGDASDDGGCDGGPEPLGTNGEPCCTSNETACAGHAQKTVLICDPQSKVWNVATVCSGSQLCASSVGAKQGSCQDPVPACAGKDSGDKVCQGTIAVTCDPDEMAGAQEQCPEACKGGACVCMEAMTRCDGNTPQTCDGNGNWVSGPTCAYVCSGGGCTGGCTPGEHQCNGQIPQFCESGLWTDGAPCPVLCSNGNCETSCTNGSKQCSSGVLMSCVGGSWQTETTCQFVCSSGACTGVCAPGTKQCVELVPQTCSASGQWQSGVACQYLCLGGTCLGTCVPGSKDCQGPNPRICDANGQIQLHPPCAFVCSGGSCQGECLPGSKKCNGKIPQDCDANGAWVDGAACASLCTAGVCEASCIPSTKLCNGNVPQTCSASSTWDDGAPCTNVCIPGGVCGGDCVPGTMGCDGQTPRSCDANGSWSNIQACQKQACVNGACQGVCAPASKQCSGKTPQVCNADGVWQSLAACSGATPACKAGDCVTATTTGPSCDGLDANCGPNLNDNCCAASLVAGGSFLRSNEAGSTASVSDFRYDKYEISVGRFRKFVDAWIGNWRPSAGDGKHTHLNAGQGLANTGGGYETGWDTSWSNILPTVLGAWDTNLMGTSGPPMWASGPGPNENKPINFANWYEVYAFCIWDGGFLPTEAEYNYAAAGGGGADGQRIYPWSDPPSSVQVDCTYANYVACPAAAPNVVGTESPKGDGKYGQADLSGNLSEWLLDFYTTPYPNPCTDCAYLDLATNRAVRGGGYNGTAAYMDTTKRFSAPPANRSRVWGARCARSP
jgi:formylglycine-generating enzyme required for sulfatase activity